MKISTRVPSIFTKSKSTNNVTASRVLTTDWNQKSDEIRSSTLYLPLARPRSTIAKHRPVWRDLWFRAYNGRNDDPIVGWAGQRCTAIGKKVGGWRSSRRKEGCNSRRGARQSGQSGFLPVEKLRAAHWPSPVPPRLANDIFLLSLVLSLLPATFTLLFNPFPVCRAHRKRRGEPFTWQQAWRRCVLSHEPRIENVSSSFVSRGLLFPPLRTCSTYTQRRGRPSESCARAWDHVIFWRARVRRARVRSGFVPVKRFERYTLDSCAVTRGLCCDELCENLMHSRERQERGKLARFFRECVRGWRIFRLVSWFSPWI